MYSPAVDIRYLRLMFFFSLFHMSFLYLINYLYHYNSHLGTGHSINAHRTFGLYTKPQILPETGT